MPRSVRRDRRAVRAAVFFFLAATFCTVGRSEAGELPLQLEVFINDLPTNLIGGFVRHDDGRIGALAGEVRDIGLHVDERHDADEFLFLDELPLVAYVYDERAQSIRITVDDSGRASQEFDLAAEHSGTTAHAASSFGAVLNYDFLVNSGDLLGPTALSNAGLSVLLDGRLFSSVGTLQQTAVLNAGGGAEAEVVRLDTTFRYSDPSSMITYRAGDVQTGAVGWTRPVRLAGLQAQSDFALRPGFISTALQNLSGVATGPSTVEVYANGAKIFQQEVGPGPFTLYSVPVPSGAGNLEMVVRDSSGRETRTSVPTVSSPRLLRPGLTEWSFEFGIPRLSYGSADDRYALTPVAVGSLRIGLLEWLTGEAHVEGGANLLNAGLGVVTATSDLGQASGAIAVSAGDMGFGAQVSAAYQTSVWDLSFGAAVLRTIGNYEDISSAIGRFGSASPHSLYDALRPPIEQDRLSVSLPLDLGAPASASVSYSRSLQGNGTRSEVLSLAYSQSLPFGGALNANAFYDFAAAGRAGFFVALAKPLDGDVSSSASVTSNDGDFGVSAELSKGIGDEIGGIGWRLKSVEGASTLREASGSYRSPVGVAQGGLRQSHTSTSAFGGLRGSISTLGGGVHFSGWIDDSFAVVKAGAANVEVYSQNKLMGVTDDGGVLVVPNLRGYEQQELRIDPAALPVDAKAGVTKKVVLAARQAGVQVDFEVEETSDAAIVTFVDAAGDYLPAGSQGVLESGSIFIVGYDGQAYVEHLTHHNQAAVTTADFLCNAAFDFAPNPGQQVQIGPVTCL